MKKKFIGILIIQFLIILVYIVIAQMATHVEIKKNVALQMNLKKTEMSLYDKEQENKQLLLDIEQVKRELLKCNQ